MTITDAIIEVANKKDKFTTQDVLLLLNNKYSRQAVSSVINRLVSERELFRSGKGPNTFYALPKNANALAVNIQMTLENKSLEEHLILEKIKEKKEFWKGVSENIISIFDYAFSEMLNNAIDHSQSKRIKVMVVKSDKHLWFEVRDMGIGVFRNIMTKRKLKSELEAIQDLLKGKTTTAPKAHSGEGIFFTSKIADEFILTSFDQKLIIENKIDDIFLEHYKPSLQGTQVTFGIELTSKKNLNDLFEKFAAAVDDFAFNKTEIKVKLYKMGTIYISRSQAKRLLSGLEKFKNIILDFDQVPTVGQAFADEVFRVFQSNHPEITIEGINMNKPVQFMVGRVEKP